MKKLIRKGRVFYFALVIVGLQAETSFLHGEVSLPALFSDRAVLQKSANTPVWGKASPGEKVVVSFGTSTAETVAGQDGKWRVELNLSQAPAVPSVLKVEGTNRREFKNVVAGEVWVCSGQSNMEFPLSRAIDAGKEIAAPANPGLREFKVKRSISPEPLENCEGQWVEASPATVGNFSAVGYFFGKKIQASLGAPVGLICAALGSTPSEAWTSYPGLSSDLDLKSATDRDILYMREYPEKKKAYFEAYSEWEKKFQREDRKDEATIQAFAGFQDKSGWSHVKIPSESPPPGFSNPGALWLVRTFNFSEQYVGKNMPLSLGTPDGFESLYWNGQLVGERNLENFRGHGEGRAYTVPGKMVKLGNNILAIRIFNPVSAPQLLGKVSHAGEWAAKMEFSLPPLTDAEKAGLPSDLKVPPDPKKVGSLLFNGMISPLIPYGIAGVIWYQGENNAERAWQYRTAFPLMIKDWRSRWGKDDLPFYFCQLANYNAKTSVPGESDWAELREAQAKALDVPNTGQAVLIDIGEAGDIHPRNKKDAGERLAAIALAKNYGKNQPYSGPVYKSMGIEGSKIRIEFDHADGGLAARALPEIHVIQSQGNKTEKLVPNSPGSQLEGFAICGEDGKWVWANALIDGNAVLVESPAVGHPVAVRYGWARNPTCNLYNGAGFPAAPFRTDDFKATTFAAKY